MRRGFRGILVVLLLATLVAAPAAAYHGESGSAGLVVSGPVAIDGATSLSSQPGVAAFEGLGDSEFLVRDGVARITLVEHRERLNPAAAAAGVAHETRRESFELPSPRIHLVERTLAFDALVFTDGGVTAVGLDAPAGVRLERAAERAVAPSAAARDAGLDPSRVPGAFGHRLDGATVGALAQVGTVSARGDFSVFLFGALARFASADAAFEERLGAWTEKDATGDVRVVRYALIGFRHAYLEVPFSSGFAGYYGSAVDVSFNGTATFANARGQAVVGDRAPMAEGGNVVLAGVISGSAWPTGSGGAGAIRYEAQGDVTALTVGPESASFLREPTAAAAASVLVVALGALAYFWPAMKTMLLAPLYSRINGPEVMDHDGRERVFAYVKAHPGASVNDVADGLDVSWSTAAYHLRVLEREGFVTGERRGRHRRFFPAGGGGTKDAAFATEHPTARAILAAVAAAPGITQKDLAALAGVTPSTASWHLQRLAVAGYVSAQREWRAVRYAPGPRFGEVAGRV